MTARFYLLIASVVASFGIISPTLAIESIQPSTQIIIDDDELLKKGRNAVHSGDLEKAVQYYEEALKRGNLSRVELVVVHSDLCVAYMYVERFEDAIDQCQKSIDMQPNRWETWNNLGTVFLVKGDYPKALSVYERALKMKPDSKILKFNKDIAEKRAQELEIKMEIERQKENGSAVNDSGKTEPSSH